MGLTVNVYEIGFTFQDFPDNSHEGAITIYLSGCDNNCAGCHNEELKNGILGDPYTVDNLILKIKELSTRYNGCDRIVLMGGDPFAEINRDFIISFLRMSKFRTTIYTGNTLEELLLTDTVRQIIGKFEYLKVGRYIKDLHIFPEKTPKYFQLSSANQEIYNKDLELITNNGRLFFD